MGDTLAHDAFDVSAEALLALLPYKALDLPTRIISHDTIEIMDMWGNWKAEFLIVDRTEG